MLVYTLHNSAMSYFVPQRNRLVFQVYAMMATAVRELDELGLEFRFAFGTPRHI